MLCETVGRNKTLIQQVTDVRNMIVMQRIPPPQVLLQEPVILHDARGRISPFHLDFINSTEAFLAVLRVRFQDLGRTKIERGEFSIEDTARNLDINLKQSWDRVFKVILVLGNGIAV
jgi:hypothetical protein